MIVLCALEAYAFMYSYNRRDPSFGLSSNLVASLRSFPPTSGSFGTNWLGNSGPDANLDIAFLLSSRAMCRLREKKKEYFFIPSITHIFLVAAFYPMHNAFASLLRERRICAKLFKNLSTRHLYVSTTLFLQAVSHEELQPRLANTKLLATSKHQRAKPDSQLRIL